MGKFFIIINFFVFYLLVMMIKMIYSIKISRNYILNEKFDCRRNNKLFEQILSLSLNYNELWQYQFNQDIIVYPDFYSRYDPYLHRIYLFGERGVDFQHEKRQNFFGHLFSSELFNITSVNDFRNKGSIIITLLEDDYVIIHYAIQQEIRQSRNTTYFIGKYQENTERLINTENPDYFWKIPNPEAKIINLNIDGKYYLMVIYFTVTISRHQRIYRIKNENSLTVPDWDNPYGYLCHESDSALYLRLTHNVSEKGCKGARRFVHTEYGTTFLDTLYLFSNSENEISYVSKNVLFIFYKYYRVYTLNARNFFQCGHPKIWPPVPGISTIDPMLTTTKRDILIIYQLPTQLNYGLSNEKIFKILFYMFLTFKYFLIFSSLILIFILKTKSFNYTSDKASMFDLKSRISTTLKPIKSINQK